MIIIEGPDGSGKTTLAKQLAQDLKAVEPRIRVKDWDIPRDQLPRREFMTVYTGLSDMMLNRSDQPVFIYDRLYYSAIVYGRVLRGKCSFPDNELIRIRETLDLWQVPRIWCLPPEEVVVANVESSVQLEGVSEHIHDIYWKYCKLFSSNRSSGIQHMRYDYTGAIQPTTPYERIVARCTKYLEKKANRRWSP